MSTKEKGAAAPPTKEKSCFIITPVGQEASTVRRAASGLIDAVIRPVLDELGFETITAAHLMPNPGSITQQILERLLADDLVVANLTGVNANVMYELAVRNCIDKPVVTLAEEGTDLPFDIAADRAVMYRDDMAGVMRLRHDLKAACVAAMGRSDSTTNPVFLAIRERMAREAATTSNVDRTMLDALRRIEANQARDANVRAAHEHGARGLLRVYFDLDVQGTKAEVQSLIDILNSENKTIEDASVDLFDDLRDDRATVMVLCAPGRRRAAEEIILKSANVVGCKVSVRGVRTGFDVQR